MNTNRNNVIEEYYRDNYKTLIKHVKNRVGGDLAAEDVVQEAFTRSLRFFDGYNSERGSFDTWFRIILTNVVNRFLNAERTGGSYSDEGMDEVEVLDTSIERTTKSEIEKLILSKPERQSEVLRMYFLLGYSAKDISSITSEKVMAIKNFVRNFTEEVETKYA